MRTWYTDCERHFAGDKAVVREAVKTKRQMVLRARMVTIILRQGTMDDNQLDMARALWFFPGRNVYEIRKHHLGGKGFLLRSPRAR